jgi:radical SAM superfamily enzyme YgiQ (UPF0313 family)
MHFLILLPPLPNPTMNPTAPVGLAYLAAILREMGVHVSTLMADACGIDADTAARQIIEARPDVLAVSVATPAVNNTIRVVSKVKQALPAIHTIAGGPHATIFPDEMIKHGIDVVARGEGEQSIADLVRHYQGQMDISAIDGISYQKNGRVIHNPDRKLIKNLNELPFPAWEFFPIRKYESIFKRARLSLPILTSRGCPGKCTFCYKGIFGSRFRIRSPQSILEEVYYLKENFKIEEFSIIDDCFTIQPKRAAEFCDLLVKYKVNVPWSLPAGIRVDTVSEALLKKLKDAGCYRVGFGIETGNADIMKSIKKGITLEQAHKAVYLAKKVGLESTANFMIGNLDETVDTVNDSIRFAIALDPDYAQFTRAIPFPGSEMYAILKNQGNIITQNWDDYDYLSNDTKIFIHKNLSHETIRKKMKAAYRRFYLRPAFVYHEIKKHFSREGLRKLLITIPFALKRLLK